MVSTEPGSQQMPLSAQVPRGTIAARWAHEGVGRETRAARDSRHGGRGQPHHLISSSALDPESQKPAPVRSQGGNTRDKDSYSEPPFGNGVSLHPWVALHLRKSGSVKSGHECHSPPQVLPHF